MGLFKPLNITFSFDGTDLQHLNNSSDSSRYPCGDDVEDNFHYFYVCPLFICQRILLFTQLRDLADF